jgi:hypothetical protein
MLREVVIHTHTTHARTHTHILVCNMIRDVCVCVRACVTLERS